MDPLIVIVFAITMLLILVIIRIPLWITFITISILLALLHGGFSFLTNVFYHTLADPLTLDLIVIMFLIAVLVNGYRSTGFIVRLSRELTLLFRKPVLVLSFVPAILGLLPVPGGALMSAPIVDKVGDELGLDKLKKVFINVWFRHIIFMVYPLSTLLILTSILTHVDLWVLITRQLPVALFMFILGLIIGFTGSKNKHQLYYRRGDIDKNILLKTFSPILTAIVLAIILSRFIDYKPGLPIHRPSMVIGVLTGIILLYKSSGVSTSDFIKILYSRNTIELTLVGFGSMLLRNTFLSIGLNELPTYIPNNISPIIITIMLPLLFSLLTGVPTSGVVLSIPIISKLMGITPSIASLIYVSAFMGYLGSPLHLCYIYTVEYMNTSLAKSYKHMAPATITTLLFAVLLTLVYP